MTTSVLFTQFSTVFGLVISKNRTALRNIRSLASINHDPLAQAIIAIEGTGGWCYSEDYDMWDGCKNQCFEWLVAQQNEYSRFCLGEFYSRGIVVNTDYVEAALRLHNIVWGVAMGPGEE